VHRDLNLIENRQRGVSEKVALFLLKGLAPALGRRAGDFDDLSACLGTCLQDVRCVLVIDNYHLLKGTARKKIADELRHCLEAYRPKFRLVLVSRRPLDEVAPVAKAHEASSIQPMLTNIELAPISAREIYAWAATQESFRNRHALVEWMHRHTGGHPWLLSKLLQCLVELPISDWPAWTRDDATDPDRERGLHTADGPIGRMVQQLHEALIELAPKPESTEDRTLGLQNAAGHVIPFVAICLGRRQ
jgi:hypothetical protein